MPTVGQNPRYIAGYLEFFSVFEIFYVYIPRFLAQCCVGNTVVAVNEFCSYLTLWKLVLATNQWNYSVLRVSEISVVSTTKFLSITTKYEDNNNQLFPTYASNEHATMIAVPVWRFESIITACWERYSYANADAYGLLPSPPARRQPPAARSLKVHTFVDIKHLHSWMTVQLGFVRREM
jgi:hypothetical protein